jgi:signal transduction histidine kinase/CheY-like chemotaxis protein
MRSFAPATEADFRRESGRRLFEQTRFGAAVVLLLWVVHALWDALSGAGTPMPGGAFAAASGLRLVLVAPAMAVFWWFALARPEAFRQRPETVALLAALVWLIALSSLIGCAAVEPAQRIALYERLWPGYLGIEFFIYVLVGLPFYRAAAGGLVIVASALSTGWLIRLPAEALANVLYYLLSSSVVGLIHVQRSETTRRRLYLLRRRAAHHVRHGHEQRIAARHAEQAADTQRVVAEAALQLVEAERVKSDEAAALKDRFFSAAYHDLQQPLSTINLFSRVLYRRLTGPSFDAARRDLAVIERASQEIGQMFAGVREIWELGQYQPRIEAIELTGLIDEIATDYTARAREKSLMLRVWRRSRPPCWVRTDRMLLKRALANLVVNAIKNTDAGGVLIGFAALPGRVRIDVCDTGVGIAPEYHSRIFEEYFQIRGSGTEHAGGFGLGLSIVRRIESALPGHRIQLSSRIGRGTRFSLEVPLGDASAQRGPVEAEGAFEHALLAGRYVLVVEDEAAVLDGLLVTLADAGCHAQGARTLAQARELFENVERSPDLLITDFRLEDGATGLDVVAQLRTSLAWAPEIPVLLVTGELLSQAALAVFPPGTRLYRKPITPALLLARIAEVFTDPVR